MLLTRVRPQVRETVPCRHSARCAEACDPHDFPDRIAEQQTEDKYVRNLCPASCSASRRRMR